MLLSMTDSRKILDELNDRAREVFRRVVEAYLAHGMPVGSRTLSRDFSEKVSPATLRNVMQDLEFLGLLESPHASAGRVPTLAGLRLFVDALLEVEPISEADREKLEATRSANEGDLNTLFNRVGAALSEITQTAALVLTPRHDEAPIKHIELIPLNNQRALAVLVFADGHVENRLLTLPFGVAPSAVREASNFLNATAAGLTLGELQQRVRAEIARRRQEIDRLAHDLVERGLALWQDAGAPQERLIVRGSAHLLDRTDTDNLARIRELFEDLERKREVAEFLELVERGDGVRIFIGSENPLFSLTGSSLVVSPYISADRRIVGAVGVIGPTRLNYGRIVPIVDYTAQLVGRMLGERTKEI